MSELKADVSSVLEPLKHFWSVCVGAGRAAEGLRAGWLSQMKEAKEKCGFRYVRFHGLFHDDMFVYTERDGKAVLNFQYVDELFDSLLAIGVRPFVEFGFCPRALAIETETVFWWKGHGSPPKDYGKWADLVGRIVQHWVERYGIQEVRKWYFEVWNEPNLHPFFRGSKSQYFELYRVTSRAVKSVDKELRMGGPSTSNFVPDDRFKGEVENQAEHKSVVQAEDINQLDWRPVWVEEFLRFCHQEHLEVDFVSTHPYPTDWALDEYGTTKRSTRAVNATPNDLRLLRAIINKSPFPNAEIHLTEWNSSSSPRDFTHDTLPAATFIVKANLDSTGLVDSMAYWTFTDIFEENGAGDTVFHGGFGMYNFQGIPKPTAHGYRFLNELGDLVLGRSDFGIITKSSATGKVQALLYHYPAEVKQTVNPSFDTPEEARKTLEIGKPIPVSLSIVLERAVVLFTIEYVDKVHGNGWEIWERQGNPANITRDQLNSIRTQALFTKRELVKSEAGALNIDLTLEPWSLVLIKEI